MTINDDLSLSVVDNLVDNPLCTAFDIISVSYSIQEVILLNVILLLR